MSQRITIDPVTRIEGHLRIDCEIENGVVMGNRGLSFAEHDYPDFLHPSVYPANGSASPLQDSISIRFPYPLHNCGYSALLPESGLEYLLSCELQLEN